MVLPPRVVDINPLSYQTATDVGSSGRPIETTAEKKRFSRDDADVPPPTYDD